jgi:hypothetical protein
MQSCSERRVELRRVAATRYEEMAKYALAQIDEWQTRTEINLLSRGLSSAEAQAFLESMPEPHELLPTLRPEDVSTEMRRELTQKARPRVPQRADRAGDARRRTRHRARRRRGRVRLPRWTLREPHCR